MSTLFDYAGMDDDGHGNHRRDDIDTAVGASIIAIGNAAGNRRTALARLYNAGRNGLTDFDLAAQTGVQQTSIGKRRGELRDAGLVCRARTEDGTGVSRPSPTGSPAAVWVLSAAGIAEAEAL